MKTTLKQLAINAKLALVWGFSWRALVVGVGSLFISFPLGFLVGLLSAAIGIEELMVVTIPLGLLVGFLSQYVFLGWIVGTSMGGYTLTLTKTE
jgi:flagellar biosynthesis protein FliQ